MLRRVMLTRRTDAVRPPPRGCSEKFAEVLGEGVVHYARDPVRNPTPIHGGYWRGFLARHADVIGAVMGGSGAERVPCEHSGGALPAAISAGSCATYCRHWRRERRVWRERLVAIASATPSVDEALRRLSLEPARPTPERLRRLGAKPTPTRITVERYVTPGSDLLAVVLPGFLDNGRGEGAATLAKAIWDSGRTAITFDPRGTWRSPGAIEEMDPGIQVQDVLDVVADQRRYRRVALIGHSLGALVACLAAAQDERITDVVAIMPPRCFVWPFDYDESLDRWGRQRRIAVWHKGVSWAFRVPHEVVTRAADHNLPAALARMDERARILFIAGSEDQVIPTDSVRRLYTECRAPEKKIRVLPIGHDYRDRPDHRKLVNDTVLKWLAEASAVGRSMSPPSDRIGRDDRRAVERGRGPGAAKRPELLVGAG